MRHLVPVLLALLVVAALVHVPLFITIAYLLGVIYLLSRLWVRHSARHIAYDRVYERRAFRGDEIEVAIRVRNTSRIPVPWLQITESAPTALVRGGQVPGHVLALGPREESSFTYRLVCRRRGYYTLGPLFLESGDLLGIDQRGWSWHRADALLVYPTVVPLDRLGLQATAALPALPTASPLIEDPARIVGVRDYQAGDSPRRIHWNATARLGRLSVRQFEPTIARETMIFLDMDRDHYGRYHDESVELAAEAAASLANHVIVREKLPVGLTVKAPYQPAEKKSQVIALPPRSERAQLISILEALARIETARDVRFDDLLREQSVRLPWGATIVAITGTAGQGLLETLLYLRRAGFAVSLVLIEPEAQAEVAGIRTHVVRGERDLAAAAAGPSGARRTR